MGDPVEIHVALVDEGTEVWRPIQAEHLHGDVYRIIEQPYDPTDESWQFEPGDCVLCEQRELSERNVLVAVRKADVQ